MAKRHKWKWSEANTGHGKCLRCGLVHRTTQTKRGGAISEYTWPDGRTETTRETPPCEVHHGR